MVLRDVLVLVHVGDTVLLTLRT